MIAFGQCISRYILPGGVIKANQCLVLGEIKGCHVRDGLVRYSNFKKASSYIAQYPVLRTVQSALHFTSLTDLFTQTPSQLLWEASSHMLQLMREGCSYTYPPLSIVRYSFIQLSELEHCRVKKLAQGFNTAARIRTQVLVVESPKLYPLVTVLYEG